jgi:AraC-like DNA-binding protein
MYNPKQIPYLLDRKFNQYLRYDEYNIDGLKKYCMCIWQIKSKSKIESPIYNTILPDGCIDLIIDYTKEEICFAGFSRNTETVELKGDVDFVGVRFKPGAFFKLFSIPADVVMDSAINFFDIENNPALNNIFILNDIVERINLIESYIREKVKDIDSTYFIDYVDELYKSPKEQTVLEISNKFGYTNRQLLRIFKENYGISPKVLFNIIRLHLCLSLLFDKNKIMNDILEQCGYYDQSHFVNDIKKYVGISPIKLLENYKC